ncbi:MAG: glycosyltransferase, partial [Candidatus Coatesbacteria bacterium]|nr:glycosyltransferase [Candidatus Coatesbacteria bacterium]
MIDRQPPVVSIIIPVFNDKEHVIRAVNSALNQTMKSVEIIVIDDGSTDGTSELLRAYGDRIALIRQENRGVSAARNAGIAFSNGDYISFLDSDDTIVPFKIELQLTALRENCDAGLCAAGTRMIDSRDNSTIRTRCPAPGILDIRSGVFPPWFHISAGFVKRIWLTNVGGFDTSILSAEDDDLWWRLWAAGCPFLLIDEVVSSYWIRRDSLSQKPDLQLSGRLHAFERHFSSVGSLASQELRAHKYSMVWRDAGAHWFRLGNMKNAEDAWMKAISFDRSIFMKPSHWKKILFFIAPSFPFHHPDGLSSYTETFRLLRNTVGAVYGMNECENNTNVLHRMTSSLCFALAESSFSNSRPWSARFWLARSLIAGLG